jgi:hypothetical protein
LTSIQPQPVLRTAAGSYVDVAYYSREAMSLHAAKKLMSFNSEAIFTKTQNFDRKFQSTNILPLLAKLLDLTVKLASLSAFYFGPIDQLMTLASLIKNPASIWSALSALPLQPPKRGSLIGVFLVHLLDFCCFLLDFCCFLLAFC